MVPILLLHGALGSADTLRPLADALRTAGRTVILPDLPGHGDSVLPAAGLTMPALAEAAFAAFDSAGVELLDVFGYSMGGYLGAHLARMVPHRIRRVATLATIWNWNGERAEKECRGLDPRKVEAKVPQFVRVLQHRHRAAPWHELMRQTAAMLQSLGERPLLSTIELGTIAQPMLLAVGDRDQTVSLEETRVVVDALPRGYLAVLPGVAHPLETVPVPVLAAMLINFFGQA